MTPEIHRVIRRELPGVGNKSLRAEVRRVLSFPDSWISRVAALRMLKRRIALSAFGEAAIESIAKAIEAT